MLDICIRKKEGKSQKKKFEEEMKTFSHLISIFSCYDDEKKFKRHKKFSFYEAKIEFETHKDI